MATRSRIAFEENNEIKSIYCHWDGYLSNNGKILFENYTTLDKVKELISLGELSSLKETIEETKENSYHIKQNENINIVTSSDVKEYSKVFEEYNYLFKDNVWYLVNDNLSLVALSEYRNSSR
jgi:hypothetical protein